MVARLDGKRQSVELARSYLAKLLVSSAPNAIKERRMIIDGTASELRKPKPLIFGHGINVDKMARVIGVAMKSAIPDYEDYEDSEEPKAIARDVGDWLWEQCEHAPTGNIAPDLSKPKPLIFRHGINVDEMARVVDVAMKSVIPDCEYSGNSKIVANGVID